MSRFTFENIESVNGVICPILQLSINGKKQFDEFENEIGANQKSDFNKINTIIGSIANGQKIPPKKFKKLINKKKDKEPLFEIKVGDLRVYLIKFEKGKMVILCGFKVNQKKDIEKANNIKNEILNLIDNKL